MKPVLPKTFVLLAVSVSAILLLNRRILSSSSSPPSFEDPDSSSSPLLVFLILNTFILTVLLGSRKQNCRGADLSCPSSDEVAENNKRGNREEGDNDVEEYSGSGRSDGYDGDDDMSGSDDEICWEDGDCTNSLEKRIEEFITMVDERWGVERFKENNHKKRVT
ncbi:hypothetical protein BT93_E0377 [Corymbia citriodora subsp. variegata]|nr:hypothetical protein BT93_E0377 [Corymbia citriodora subsp. variegata]